MEQQSTTNDGHGSVNQRQLLIMIYRHFIGIMTKSIMLVCKILSIYLCFICTDPIIRKTLNDLARMGHPNSDLLVQLVEEHRGDINAVLDVLGPVA